MKSDRIKKAEPDHEILEPMVRRWSPYAFDPAKKVSQEKLLACLEAARWAPSSYNEQPWAFIVAHREDEQAFANMLNCLVEANQQWAKNASVLMITVVKRHFEKNGKPNRVAEHCRGSPSV